MAIGAELKRYQKRWGVNSNGGAVTFKQSLDAKQILDDPWAQKVLHDADRHYVELLNRKFIRVVRNPNTDKSAS